MLQYSPSNNNKDIFKVLPNDVIGDILSFSSHIEIIFNHARVCKYWKITCLESIWNYYVNSIFIRNCALERFDDEFLYSKLGRKFIKYLIQRHVYDLAGKLNRSISTVSNEKIIVNEHWVDTELSITKSYFKQFSDLKELPMLLSSKPKANDQSSQRFLSSVFSAIGSFFWKITAQPSADSSITCRNETEKFTFKVVLDGCAYSGKSSFLNCGVNNKPVDPNVNFYYNNVGIEFENRVLIVGDTVQGKLQLWDKLGRASYSSLAIPYFRNAAFIILLVDPFNKESIESISQYLETFKMQAPTADVILITTKKDKDQERLLTNEQAELIAFDSFGGLHLDITNTELDEPRQILLYCTLLKYFLLPQN